MPISTIHVKIRRNRQTIRERDLVLDPDDDVQVRGALTSALKDLGVTPSPAWSIELYQTSGTWIRKVDAA